MLPAVRVVALTGGIGAGKSTVAEMLAARGALVVDVDAIGRAVLEPGGRAGAAVRSRFGDQVAAADGGIDRAALADVVFGDPEALAALTAISHPSINEVLSERLADVQGVDVAVLDMAILVEGRLALAADGTPLYDSVLVVEAPWPLRLERLTARGVTAEQAVARRDAQATDAERRAVADVVIVNDGNLSALAQGVAEAWDALRLGGRGLR
jgi:dephospho-CoA kinase